MSKAASQDEGSADHQSRPILLGSLLILCLLGVAFYPVWQGGLVYDDCEVWGPEAVDQLGFVREGISISGMSEALRCRYGNNWQPVSWWSHMLDASLFGPDTVGPAHGVNLLIHGLSTLRETEGIA